MNTKNDLPRFNVQVGSGSGCLFQPTDNSYAYVLTAAHVIKGKRKIKITQQLVDSTGKVSETKIEVIGTPFIHDNPKKDAAIIKIKPIENIQNLIRVENCLTENESFYLCGFPSTRIAKGFKFRSNELEFMNKVDDGYCEAKLFENSRKDEIDGQSGGGIIGVSKNCFLLAGIQSQMSADDDKEAMSRIDIMPLSFFDEIVEQNNNELSQLFPPYIVAFDKLLKDIFLLHQMVIKKAMIRADLENIAEAICKNFFPDKILKEYAQKLLVEGTSSALVTHKQLWICFLELLCISQLHHSGTLSFEDLAELHKKRKLFFIDTDDWTSKLEQIYRTDLSDVEKGGYVVIGASNDTQPTRLELTDHAVIPSIADIPRTEMNISNTVVDVFSDLKIVHIFKFQSHIINNHALFSTMNASNSINILQHATKGII